MSFRVRLHITFLAAVIIPMVALAFVIRYEMTNRLTSQYKRRVEALVTIIEDDLDQSGEEIAASLAVLKQRLVADNRFRRAADGTKEERRYLLDYAGSAMQLAALSMLQIQDASGRIMSSGHFRNEFDRVDSALPKLLASTGGATTLVHARTPDSPFLALARVDSARIAGKQFAIVGGVTVGEHFLTRLARDDNLRVKLTYPGGVLGVEGTSAKPTIGNLSGEQTRDDAASTGGIVRELRVAFVDSRHGELGMAIFEVSHDLTELRALLRNIDRWFLIAVAAAAVLAMLFASWLASRMSRPIVALAEKTSRIDLDRLDVDFGTRRKDEVGTLARMLGAMTERLRASAVTIKEAERRATLGEMARQVNHDIKNGLTPIRNVFRHLTQLSASDPGHLPAVLRERQATLDSSISYLENLASSYAKLSPSRERRPCDVNTIIERVAAEFRGLSGVHIKLDQDATVRILGDEMSLRRVFGNLLHNAVDSLDASGGNVTVSTGVVVGEDNQRRVHITVSDTGAGMSAERLTKIFDDFYTTKDKGTGLGLSIVRRLVMDLDGTIRFESDEGAGTRVFLDFPGVA